jgi:hypothetical protein
MALIEDRDTFNIVAGDFLDFKDIVNLDTAILSADERGSFLELLRTLPYKPPFHNSLEKWWRNHKKTLKWLSDREMFAPEGGSWHVNKKLWISMITDTQHDYKKLISNMTNIFFEGFGSPYNLEGLEFAESLQRLQVCNYHLPEPANPIPPFPTLKTLVLQNSKVNNVSLTNFSGAENISELQLRHVSFEPVSQDLIDLYMNRILKLEVLNKVPEFFELFCRVPNRVEIASIDMLHLLGNTEVDLTTFLKNSPNLRELHISRMCIDIPSVFELISKFNPNLEYLELNHVRLCDKGTTFVGELPFSRLKVATLLPVFDDSFLKILQMTSQKVRHFHISFAEKLTDGGYLSIRDALPHLEYLDIEEKKDLFDGEGDKSDRVQRIANYFLSVPNVRIALWDSWQAEIVKAKYIAQRLVKYCKGSFPEL